jgi:PhzF family phenazine biosynthesis protein
VLRATGTPGRIELDFPAYTPTDGRVPDGLARALGAEPTGVAVVADRDSLFVELADAATVRDLRPDFAALRAVVDTVGVTAPADDDRADFVSRYFAPGAGIDEDPVTGSAHCVLGPYWAAKLGRTELTGYQASARGGYVGVRLVTSPTDGDRALLTGDAVTVWSGSLAP